MKETLRIKKNQKEAGNITLTQLRAYHILIWLLLERYNSASFFMVPVPLIHIIIKY